MTTWSHMPRPESQERIDMAKTNAREAKTFGTEPDAFKAGAAHYRDKKTVNDFRTYKKGGRYHYGTSARAGFVRVCGYTRVGGIQWAKTNRV